MLLKNQNWNAIHAWFFICKVINDRAYDLQDPTGHFRWTAGTDIQLLMPAEYVVSTLPDIKAFG